MNKKDLSCQGTQQEEKKEVQLQAGEQPDPGAIMGHVDPLDTKRRGHRNYNHAGGHVWRYKDIVGTALIKILEEKV